jgi:dolichyl-phosphate-mannose-protein mannosyltransferase
VTLNIQPKEAIRRDSILLFLASWIFFLINLSHPITRNFDEFHYIPSALQWLSLTANQNWEHPPLAKLLIAIGVGVFGDNPVGWRIMSTLFGSITLVGMYHLAYALFANNRQAAWVCAALTLFNQLLYVQARIAMLDTFMMGFLVWALWGVARSIEINSVLKIRYIRTAGVCMGLAIACKWFAIVPYFMCLFVLVFEMIRQRSPNKAFDILLYWIMTPALFYFASFLPYLLVEKTPAHTLSEIFTTMQTGMLDGQKRVVNNHPYMSSWMDWITLKRPIWYAFDREGDAHVRGVLLLGNPLIMWGGLVAVVACALDALVRLHKGFEAVKTSVWIFYFYAGFALCWIAIPRKVAFYYYYYPAGMILSIALTYWLIKIKRPQIIWSIVGLVMGVFIYFFPILAALKIDANTFTRWMWLRSWI